MFKNYFTVAIRNFWRNKTFSFINVLGLSIGISAALVIFLIVFYEFSYDKFEAGRDRIYRVVMDAKINGQEGHSAALPAPLGGAVQSEVTGVELTVPVFVFQGDGKAKVAIVTGDPSKPVIYKKQPGIIYTNQQYFQLLPYQWVAGSPEKALQNPFAVVLAESKAKQYFPGIPIANILGKQITYNDDLKATVTGVVKNLEETTSFNADEFLSLSTISKTNLQKQFMMDVWNDWMAYSTLYIKLAKGSSASNIETQLKALLHKYNRDVNKDDANTMAFKLQPLSDVHFNHFYASLGLRSADKSTLYGLLAIAAFLLLLGCINFINLTTAQASRRTKEIGIRKTMGSTKRQLIFQFLSETFLVTFLATVLSIALTPLLLRMFADFIPPGLNTGMLYKPGIGLFLISLIVLVSLLSGLYPALILSGYQPALILKNQAHIGHGQTRSTRIRKTLTVAQFVIAQFFIIATIMVSKQIYFSINSSLGFKTEAILNFNLPFSMGDSTATFHRSAFLNKVNEIPGIQLMSTGFFAPADDGVAYGNVQYVDSKKEIKANVQVRWGDSNYIKVYQIKLLAGRNVLQGDSVKECLINNTYARLLGFQKPAEALNKRIKFNDKIMPVVGVMADFRETSTHTAIDPVIFSAGIGDNIHIALQPQNADGTAWQNTITKLGKAYKDIYPNEEFSYTFLDEKIARFYTSEQNTAHLLNWSTGLTVLISCLGLFGLVLYTTNTRTKEIGVRKILGASVSSIVSILSKDFIKLVVLAFIIAAPLAYWASYKWLDGFAYKTSMSWWVFAASGLSMVLLAWMTLSIQTIKAAMANPVGAIKNE